MKAELIAVGTELLLGNITNTNARDLSIMLSELGIDVYWHSVVGDNPARLRDALTLAKSRADIIITTGGLGPTCDDLTKQTIAEVFGREMYFDERAERDIEEFFRKIGAPMTENNRAQAYLPRGCTPFYNTCGTAPGCAFFAEDRHVLMLPGPPREMKAMMKNGGLAYLRGLSDEQIFSHNIHIFGMGESYVESLLRDRMNELKNPTLAPYAATAEVRLRVTAKAKTEAEAETLMLPVIDEIRSTLGEVVYGVDTGSLENTVLLLLKKQGKTLAAAESCTGGMLAKRMTDLPGASAVFRGGVTVYTNDAKRILLGVDEKTLEEKSAVSREVAEQLAENVRARLQADFGIGITGVAGPESDGLHPVGTVFVSLADGEGVHVRALRLSPDFDRERIRITAADHALDMLRRALTGCDIHAEYGE